MYEFHGWCKLRMRPEEEYGRQHLQTAVEALERVLGNFDWPNGFCSFRPFNGEYFVHFGGYQNRPRTEPEKIAEVLRVLVKTARESYGIVHFRDDEAKDPRWRVIVIKDGAIREDEEPRLPND